MGIKSFMNMSLKFLFYPCLLFLGIYACKQEASTNVGADNTKSVEPAAEAVQTTSSEENPNLVANMSWTFLTDQLFHHGATVKSGISDPDLNKGHWMDFHDNGTYDYGVWGEKSYDGHWTYDETTRNLQLKPSGSQKPSEWQVMHKDRKLILIGTHTYGDNAYQVQWIRYPQRPDKNAKPGGYQGD